MNFLFATLTPRISVPAVHRCECVSEFLLANDYYYCFIVLRPFICLESNTQTHRFGAGAGECEWTEEHTISMHASSHFNSQTSQTTVRASDVFSYLSFLFVSWSLFFLSRQYANKIAWRKHLYKKKELQNYARFSGFTWFSWRNTTDSMRCILSMVRFKCLPNRQNDVPRT